MEILEIRTLRGPNYWSGYWKKLIIMRLDIADYEEKPSDKLTGFYERMVEVMPSLESHGCSYSEPGGFLRRVKEEGFGRIDRRAKLGGLLSADEVIDVMLPVFYFAVQKRRWRREHGLGPLDEHAGEAVPAAAGASVS